MRLLELRLADDLGGKGYLLFDGTVTDVEAAVEIGVARGRRDARHALTGHRPAARGDGRGAGRRRSLRGEGAGVAMQLARVTGTLVASTKVPGLEGVKLLIIQPLDRQCDRREHPWSLPTRCTWPVPASWSTS